MKGRDIALLLILGAVWGASFMFIKIILRDMTPLTLVGYRIGLGALGLLAFYGVDQLRRRQTGPPVESFPLRRLALPSLILGIFNGIIPYLSITWGETYISSGEAAILNATTPLFTTIIIIGMGRRAGGEQTSLTRLLGLAVGFAGVAVLVSGGGPQAGVSTENAWLGSVAILVASASYAVGSLYARKAFTGVPVIYPAVGQNVAAALVLLPFTLLTPPQHGISSEGLLALLALGLGGTALAYLIYFQLIARVGATRTVIVTYLLPGTALIYGALILSEPIHLIALSGLALVLLGIALTGGIFDRGLAFRLPGGSRRVDAPRQREREV
jgi:drug/metabolite transporter (DMT)-like permease